ncbi:hypothetical protein GCM10022252_75920 [Streptosporangium oxazolinicum]|uniref:Uncharacterized protein n=1 Tax=Streptosporangium oxazolinicum TaxID=909287 RepID=A0ABP8BKZ0_9ACTN
MLSADFRRKKPREVPRPEHVRRSRAAARKRPQGGGSGMDRAMALMMATTRSVS